MFKVTSPSRALGLRKEEEPMHYSQPVKEFRSATPLGCTGTYITDRPHIVSRALDTCTWPTRKGSRTQQGKTDGPTRGLVPPTFLVTIPRCTLGHGSSRGIKCVLRWLPVWACVACPAGLCQG